MISETGDTCLLILRKKEHGLLVILHFRCLWCFYVLSDVFCFSEKQKLLLKRFEGLIWRPCKSRLSDLTLKRFHLESLTLCMVTVKLLAFSFFSIDFRNSKLILKQKYRLFALKLFSWIKQSELFKVIIKSCLFVSITVGSMGENFF